MGLFRAKARDVEAERWTGFNHRPKAAWLQRAMTDFTVSENLDGSASVRMARGNGTLVANKGDWIVKTHWGEVYACPADIFTQVYERGLYTLLDKGE